MDIPIIYHRAKTPKKLMREKPIPEKNLKLTEKQIDGRTDGRMDRQTDNGDFIRPSVGLGGGGGVG